MAKKTSGQNLVDEAYLRSLMAGVPSEPALSPAPSVTGESGENRETILSGEKRKPDDSVNETEVISPVRIIPAVRKWLRIGRLLKRYVWYWPTLSVSSLHPINVMADRGCI